MTVLNIYVLGKYAAILKDLGWRLFSHKPAADRAPEALLLISLISLYFNHGSPSSTLPTFTLYVTVPQ